MKPHLLIFVLFITSIHAGETLEAELARLQHTRASATTQTDMNIASYEVAQCWDRILKKEEAAVLVKFDAEGLKLFISAQKAWRDFRDAEIALRGDQYRGGSISSLIVNGKFSELTEQRVKEIRELFKP